MQLRGVVALVFAASCASTRPPIRDAHIDQAEMPVSSSVEGATPAGSAQGAQVAGSLDKELIRGVIRTHLLEVKRCYEAGLVTSPLIQGRVMIRFTIGAGGDVVAAVVQRSTLGAPAVEECIAASVRAWKFPPPSGGGIVMVSYPFLLKKDGGHAPEILASGEASSVSL
jgi:TonB family protein